MEFTHGIISGHGGDMEFQTEGHKMKRFPDGKVIYEGIENKIVKDSIINAARIEDMSVIDLNPDPRDISLERRVEIIYDYHSRLKLQNIQLLVHEIHMNAFNGKVKGREFYTTTKHNFSDKMADVAVEVFDKVLPVQKKRYDFSDGDPDKEKNFYIIKNSPAFAVLYELLFFDNREEVDRYLNPSGYALFANIFIKIFKQINHLYG